MGCPVLKRAWALPQWFKHIYASAYVLGESTDLAFAFVADERDTDTVEVMLSDSIGFETHVTWTQDDLDVEARGPKYWNHDRFHRMVELRNQLLALVRESEADYFLSLDSDIFIQPRLIANLIESSERFAAVGGRTYMGSGTTLSSFMMMKGNVPQRGTDTEAVFPVDVIMAIKLMTPAAYAVDYEWHGHGEDVGWCQAVKAKGLTLGWDGRLVNKHVMHEDRLDEFDKRVGF